MNAPSSNSKCLALALGVLAIAACSAEASAPPTPPGGNNNAGTGTGGTGSNGTAGNLPLAGTTPGPVAGTTGNGTAGMATGTGGMATGTAGTGGAPAALTACPTPNFSGTATDLLIDDVEDGDNLINKIGQRAGVWYTFLDTFGVSTITPAKGVTLTPGTTDCHGASKGCVIISGVTDITDEVAMTYPFAGVGFDFVNATKSCPYDASAYTGVKFWARGDVQIRVKVNVATTTDAGGGGTCMPVTTPTAMGCNDAHGTSEILSPTWTEYTVPFATVTQEGWGVVGAMDKTTLLALQFQIPPGQTFNAAFDDITFY
jgi:hypothetical protein